MNPWGEKHQWFSRPPPWAGLGYPSTSKILSFNRCKTLMKPFFIWVSIPLEVKIKIPQDKKSKKISDNENETIASIIIKLGYDLDTVVVLQKNTPVPETTPVSDELELTLIEITSKG